MMKSRPLPPDAPPAVLEALEPRLLLDGNLLITEFMADNPGPYADEEGHFHDWIEVHNPTPSAVSLDNWYLTDKVSNLTKWAFPNVTIEPGAYLVVFASEEDRRVPGQPLHTNFQLAKSGEYLGLTQRVGDEVVRVSEFYPVFPEQFEGVSYGLGQNLEVTTLVGEGAAAAILVPTGPSLGLDWTATTFDDSGWTLRGPTGVGYQARVPGFAVRNVFTNTDISNLAAAEDVLGNPVKQTSVYSENAPVINYYNTGGTGRYTSGNRAYPGTTINVDANRFVTEALATLTIPTAGAYTFGVNSDDGFGLTLTNGTDTFSISYTGLRGTDDTLGVFNVTTPGQYSLRLVVFENTGGAAAELFAARGSFSAWNATDFRLVGDTAGGGLAVEAEILGGTQTNYRSLIQTDVESAMRGVNASAYVRIPFTAADPTILESLTLKIKYDDGFIAYLNGQEVARRNAPASAQWNSAATAAYPSGSTFDYELINLTAALPYLRAGANVLAFHALNVGASDGDFLLLPQLVQLRTLGLAVHYFATPTPGALNSTSYYAVVADTKFSHDRGFYTTAFDVAITTATPGATVRYTLNGSAPTATTGTVYTGPVRISTTAVLRAAAFKTGYEPTDVDTQTYIFLNDVIRQPTAPAGFPSTWGYDGGSPVAADYEMDPDVVNSPLYSATIKDDLMSISTMSLAMNVDDMFGVSGIYSNPLQEGPAWERACSLELIDPAGGDEFQVNAGARIYGGVGRQPRIKRHSFRVFFKDVYGPTKLQFPLFGEDAADRFDSIILRANFNDAWNPSSWGARSQYMRDEWARRTQLAMGDIASHGRYVHLYINGLYWGLYNAVERPDASFAASYSGGEREDYDALNSGAVIEGNRTAWDEMMRLANTGTTAPGGTFNANALANPAAYQQIQQYVDLASLTNYIFLNFYAGNWDWDGHNWYAARKRAPGQPWLFFAWDTEWIMGSLSENVTNKNNNDKPTRVFTQLRANADYRMLAADQAYKLYFNGGPLTAEATGARYAAVAADIDRAIVAESARWGDLIREPPYTRNAEWLTERNWFLNTYFPQRSPIALQQLRSMGLYPNFDPAVFSQRGGTVPAGFQVTLTNPGGSGTIYYTLDGSDPRLSGGGISATARAYTGPIAFYESTLVRVRVKNGSEWSAVNEAAFVMAEPPPLRVTEVMYHPAPPPVGSPYVDEDFEFIEVANVGTSTLNLGGIRFDNGIDFTFPTMTLGAGAYVVVVRNLAAFQSRYGTGINVAGSYAPDNLDNAGEQVRLVGRFDELIQEFTYDNSWLPDTDGGGFSLCIIDPRGDLESWNDPAAWRLSALVGGSPGQENLAWAPGTVVINEVMTHTDVLPPGDWIELKNTTAEPVNIGGWYLSDAADNLRKYRIAAGTSLLPGQCKVFTQAANFGNVSDPGCLVAFSLSELGEEVRLTAVDEVGNLTGYREVQDFGPALREVTFGRHVTSAGKVDFVALASATPNADNAAPLVGPVVISELMYHPADGGDEFLELHNLSAAAVPLYDPAYPANTWYLTGAAYTFPTGVVIPAGGYLLVVGIEPALFRTKYGVPESVAIHGPYSGALNNAGESVKLWRPGSPEPGGFVPYVLVDRVKYDDAAPWPLEPDGTGPSLARTPASAYGNDPANWTAGPLEGTPGAPNAMTDVTPPRLASVKAEEGIANKVFVTFNEAVEPVTALNLANYAVTGVTLHGAAFGENDRTVVLTTSALEPRVVYTLTAAGVRNLAGLLLIPGSQASFTYALAGTGLQATYYNNADFTLPRISRLDPLIDFGWGTGSPHAAVDPDTFSIRWTGHIKAPYTGTYTFYLVSDEGARLWIENQLLIDHWTAHTETEVAATIALLGGRKYDFKLDYYEGTGEAVCRLLWSGPNLAKAVVPTKYLFAVTDPPVTAGDRYDVTFNTALVVPAATGVLANDVDYDGHTLTATLVSGVSRGSLAFSADGSFSYTPAAGWGGEDTFTYKAYNGHVYSAVTTVRLVVDRAPFITAVVLNGRAGRGPSAVDPGTAGVRTLQVTFNEPVTFAASDVRLQTVTFDGGVETVTAELSPLSVAGSGTSAMTVTLPAGTVVDTWVKVTLCGSATLRDLQGLALDGEAKAGGSGRGYVYAASLDLPTGDAAPGGDAVFYVGSLCGDFTPGPGPGRAVTLEDVDGFLAAYQVGDLDADFRGVGFGAQAPDGLVTRSDIAGFLAVYQTAVAAGRRLDALPEHLGGPLAAGPVQPLLADVPTRTAAPALPEPDRATPAPATVDGWAYAASDGAAATDDPAAARNHADLLDDAPLGGIDLAAAGEGGAEDLLAATPSYLLPAPPLVAPTGAPEAGVDAELPDVLALPELQPFSSGG